MPVYEYICDTCEDEFEVRRSFSETGVPACPQCNGSGHVRRKFTAPIIVFKGSGFYVNDSKGKSSTSSPSAKSESDSSTSTESKSSGDSGDKKEPKAEKAEKKETASASKSD